MKMGVHIKLTILFMIGWLFVAGGGMAVNITLQKSADEQKLLRKKNQVEELAEKIHDHIYGIEMQVLEWSISSEINMFSLYTREDNWNEIYKRVDGLYRQFQKMKSNYGCLNGLWLVVPRQDRQITDAVRYGEINRSMYEFFLDVDSFFVTDAQDLYYVSRLPVKLKESEISVVAAGVSLPKLLEEHSSSIEDMEVRLICPSEMISGGLLEKVETVVTGEWQKEESGWTITYPIPMSREENEVMYVEAFLPAVRLRDSRQFYLIWSIVLMMAGMFAILCFYVLLRRIVMRPLNVLLEAFDDVANGNTKTRIDSEKTDEFGRIYQHYNEIIDRLNVLIEKEYKANIIAKNAEIKYLQAQMKPHFLYNSFYQIYRICRAEDAEEAANFSLLLSKYFEYVTRSGDDECMVTFFEECCQAKRYVQIQQFRFGERLQVFFDIPEDILQYRVPKFILQPILENAIKYAYEGQKVKCSTIIKVTGKRRGEFLEIAIEDDGKTLDDVDIAAIQQKLNESMQYYKNNGLTNVHLRLKMLSEQGGIQLSLGEMGGLRAEMDICIQETSELGTKK